MKSRLSFVILAFFFCAAFAFSEETAPTLDPDLVGEWVGTAPETIEGIDGVVTCSYVFKNDGTFVVNSSFSQQLVKTHFSPVWGTWSSDAGLLVLTLTSPTASIGNIDYSFNPDKTKLTLRGPDEKTYEFIRKN